MQMLGTNLANYDHKRMVVLGPHASVYDAARAFQANHVGCIVVAEGERVLGIVTDRDLALRVVGYELDPRGLVLSDVMTPDVATIAPIATEADAAELMLSLHVRRIPIQDSGKVVGLVTLDDLIVHGFDPGTVARIVAAQLADPARLKQRGDMHPVSPSNAALAERAERARTRHRARADASYHALLRRVMKQTGLVTREDAEAALEGLLAGLVERLTLEEAADMLAQLPDRLRERLAGVTRGPNRRVTRESIEHALSLRLGIGEARAAELIVQLGTAVEGAVSSGELVDVKAQLPPDLRSIFG